MRQKRKWRKEGGKGESIDGEMMFVGTLEGKKNELMDIKRGGILVGAKRSDKRHYDNGMVWTSLEKINFCLM